MTSAEGAIAFEALEAQAAAIMNLFVAAGYERVAPSFIQPASLFLDRIGETIRARTYVFTDPNGEELCLRPDLTIPVCRIFLERHAADAVAKFCYNGPAFRMQEGAADPLRPREFRQAGVEHIGAPGPDADRDVLAMTLNAVRSSGLKDITVRLGHIGLLTALLAALPMPERWRERLYRSFWRPKAFNAELKKLSTPRAASDFNEKTPIADENALFAHLDRAALPLIGTRTPGEVLQHLRDKADDAAEDPLPQTAVAAFAEFLRLEGPAPAVISRIADFGNRHHCAFDPVIKHLESLTALASIFVKPEAIHFASDFGRHFEYYTGAVFQIEVAGQGVIGQVAGGGRYDRLIHALSGGERDVPAVGAAIHTERLLFNVSRAASS